MQSIFVRMSGLGIFAFLLVILPLSGSASAQAIDHDRITQAIQGSKLSALEGSIHPLARAQYDQGLVESSLALHGMTLHFKPSATQQAALTALLKAQQDPTSPSYRHWLSTEEFATRFGMTASDLAKVTAWLQSQGFSVDHVAESHNAISFSGTAALAEAAFHTRIHKYSVDGESHFANATAISLPSAFADTVVKVGGLNDFKLKPRFIRQHSARSGTTHAQFTSGPDAPDNGAHYLAPSDFAVIYDLNPLYTAGYTGTGQSIGIMGQTAIVMADITSFRSNAQLPANNPTVFIVPNTTPGDDFTSGDINEADLDLEWSGGVAPNAAIVFVTSDDVIDSLQYAIENKINGVQLPVLSISYGGCEQAQSQSYISSLEATLQQANSQGQTVIGVAGDNGAADCDYTTDPGNPVVSAVNGLAVDYPGSSAYVTDLGGSEFMGDGTAQDPDSANDQYWTSSSTGDLVTSALSYIPESVWNDTEFLISNDYGGLAGGGGGASLLFTKPSWQAGVPGIPADGVRDVPDISLNASPNHDGYLVCTQVIPDSDTNPAPTNADFTSSCMSGFRLSDPGYNDDEYPTVYGGTSAAAPGFAGILALIEQKLGAPQGLGNINPTLYTLASSSSTYATAFHDIATGNNQVPCTAGSPDCPSSGVLGFTAGTGYDQASGLGSVDGNALATAFTTIAVTPGTTTTVAVSPANPTTGTAVTLTATVTANSGPAVPTGSVAFSIDGAAFTMVPLSQGTAAATTNFATGGTHTVVATYTPANGANFFGSTSTTTINVTASGLIATATTVTLDPASTVPIGGSLAITATVTATPATGALAGTVTFYAGTIALNSTPVALIPGASGTGTATYTVPSVATDLGFVIGSSTVTAKYSGTGSYGGSSSLPAPITVTNPAITLAVPNMTISSANPGNSGSSTITLTSTGGYAGTVDLTATATSLNAGYSITPTSVVLTSGGTATASISIETVAASVRSGIGGKLLQKSPSRATGNHIAAGAAAVLSCIFLLGIPGFRKRRWPMLTALLLLAGLGAGLGCGGGGPSGATPSGTYTVTVIGTDSANSAITVSTSFTVTIQ